MSSLFHKREKKSEMNVTFDTTSLDEREASFRNSSVRWPSSLPPADTMADAGFYFTPTEKYSDACTCFRCGIKMQNWLPGDNPKIEHKRFSASCKEVKTWTDVPDDLGQSNPNRAEQTDSHRIRYKLADKAKRLTGGFHRKSESPLPNMPLPSLSKEAEKSSAVAADRELNEEEKLASVQRQREVAEKSLEGLEKLASFYPQGSQEQKRAEQSISLQSADLDRLRAEESKLASGMDSLSFGRCWNQTSMTSPEVEHGDQSPSMSGRASHRAVPKLPSQMAKESSMMKVPFHMTKTPAPMMHSIQEEVPSYDQYQLSKSQEYAIENQSMSMPMKEEWIEYHTEDGTPYYYSTLTKTTAWEIPTTSSSYDTMNPVSSN